MVKIYQEGSYDTLYGGQYKGTISLVEALKKGDSGIGTLDGASGEVIILDGKAYKGNSENQVRQVKAEETLPYLAILSGEFEEQVSFDKLTMTDLLEKLKQTFKSRSLPQAIEIKGQFQKVEISNKPDNNTEAYLDILAKQPHFKKANISGTIVGIWSPKQFSSLYGDGYHLHFISEDKSFAGHLVNFTSQAVTVQTAVINKIEQNYPEL